METYTLFYVSHNNLTSLSLPDSLLSIGNKAFICNAFPSQYAVSLPTNTSWNKNWLECPFGCKNDLGKLTDGIQYVVQGTAVYEFQAHEYGWVIVSYTPDNSNPIPKVNTANYTVGTANLTNKQYVITPTNTTQAGWQYTSFTQSSNFNDLYAPLTNSQSVSNLLDNSTNIDNYCIYTIYNKNPNFTFDQMNNNMGASSINTYQNNYRDGWLFYFQNNGTTFDIDTNGGSSILGANNNTPFHISLFDPTTGQYVFNLNIDGNTSYLNLNDYLNGDYVYQYTCQPGDILSIYGTSNGNNPGTTNALKATNWNINVASNFDLSTWQQNSMNGEVTYNSTTSGSLNTYMDLYTSWTANNGLNTNLVIKKTGLFSSTGTTTLSDVSYNATAGTLALSGTSLPNIKFDVQINGQTITNSSGQVITVSSDNAGAIDATLSNIGTKYTESDTLTLLPAGSATSTSQVILPAPFTTHIQGNNPKLSFIGIKFADGSQEVEGNILANGITNTLEFTSEIKNYWPAYANPFGFAYGAVSHDNFATMASTTSAYSQIDVSYELPNSSTWTVAKYTINANTTLGDVQTFFANIPYQPGEKLALWGQNASVNNFFCNNEVNNFGYIANGGSAYNLPATGNVYPFEINNNDMVALSSDNLSDICFYPHTINSSATNYSTWTFSYGWALQTGMLNTLGNSINWYNPNQLMVQVANKITSAYTSPIKKIMAIEDWVIKNKDYNPAIDSLWTVRQMFSSNDNSSLGFAFLTASLLKLDGFVSQIVTGNTNSTGVSSQSVGGNAEISNHYWVKVWIPAISSWITLDPTLNALEYDNQFGGLANYFNITRSNMQVVGIMWPEHAVSPYYDNNGTLSYHHYDLDNYLSYFKGCEYDALINLGRYWAVPNGMYTTNYDLNYATSLSLLFNWAANADVINTSPSIANLSWTYNLESMTLSDN